MRHPVILLAVLFAFTLGACAARQPEPAVLPPLALAVHAEDTPRDEACIGLIERAVTRDAQGGFKLAGMLNSNTHPQPGQSKAPLIPIGSHPANTPSRQLDGTFRALYVNCETRQAYVSKRGAVIDITYWYGPFGL